MRILYVKRDAESARVLDKRSQFQQVLADARAGRFSMLIVDRMNRLTRSEDLGDFMAVMTELRAAGVRVVFSDREYEQSPTGQLQQFLDAYVSAVEQSNRRRQSLLFTRNRTTKLGLPQSGPWALYGYRWADAEKTRLEKEQPESEARRTVERIWAYFLHATHATLRGMAMILNQEGVRTPRQYVGVAPARNANKTGPRWTASTVRAILMHPVYWGGDEHGKVPTFTRSKHGDPELVPAYAPPYVTRGEEQRVHARLHANQRHAPRNAKREWPTLLQYGLARCGHCGWRLQVYQFKQPLADGSPMRLYRCRQAAMHGKKACQGASISADTLDWAVIDTLTTYLSKGHYLENLFAAWDADADAAMGQVHTIEQTLNENQQKIAN